MLREFTITSEPLPDKVIDALPQHIRDEYEDLFYEVRKSPKETISRSQALVEKYPHVRPFSNLLAMAYQASGDTKKANVQHEENYRRFPDYLFAKIGYAEMCLASGRAEKIPQIFDHHYDLCALYPGRNVFHVSEMAAFAGTIGEEEIAKTYYELLENIVSRDNPARWRLRKALRFMRITRGLSRFLKKG